MNRGTRLTRQASIGIVAANINRYKDRYVYVCVCVRLTLFTNDNETFTNIEMPFCMREAFLLAQFKKTIKINKFSNKQHIHTYIHTRSCLLVCLY